VPREKPQVDAVGGGRRRRAALDARPLGPAHLAITRRDRP